MSNEFYQIKWNEHSSYRVIHQKIQVILINIYRGEKVGKPRLMVRSKQMDTSKWFKPKVKHFAFQFQIPNYFAVHCSLVLT